MASKHKFEIEAFARHDIGKGASRRLRREEKVPGVIYGGGKEPVSLSFEHKKLAKALEAEAFYSHILTLKVASESEKVILKALQRHPYKPRIMHVDFQRIRADEKLHMHIPLHFISMFLFHFNFITISFQLCASQCHINFNSISFQFHFISIPFHFNFTYFITLHFISFHSYFVLFHFVPFHFISAQFFSCHSLPFHFMTSFCFI